MLEGVDGSVVMRVARTFFVDKINTARDPSNDDRRDRVIRREFDYGNKGKANRVDV